MADRQLFLAQAEPGTSSLRIAENIKNRTTVVFWFVFHLPFGEIPLHVSLSGFFHDPLNKDRGAVIYASRVYTFWSLEKVSVR